MGEGKSGRGGVMGVMRGRRKGGRGGEMGERRFLVEMGVIREERGERTAWGGGGGRSRSERVNNERWGA